MQLWKSCGFSRVAFSRKGPFRAAAFAAVGLRPRRSGNRCFYGTRSPAGSCRAATEGPFQSAEAENTVKRSSRRTGVNLQYFRVEPTSLGSERGEQPLSCNDDDRCLRQKQEGVVGAVASRMQGPLKGRSIRWEPQPVQGRGVSRGREGGVETPLSPSGPAERPRRRCSLQKASDLPHATTLCAGKDDLELPPLCSGNRSGRIIFYSRLSRSAERSKRIFTGGAVPVNCIGYRNCILRGVPSPQISGQSTAFCV